MATKDAAWWRAYRNAKSGRNGKPGPAPTAKCGTTSGYNRHLREAGAPVKCAACRAAWSEYSSARQREARAAKRAAKAAANS